MIVDSAKVFSVYESFLPDISGRAVLIGNFRVNSFGIYEEELDNFYIQGILCGSDIGLDGFSDIRWMKDNFRAVIHEGIVSISTDNFTTLGDGVFVDSVGKIYSEHLEGTTLVRNAKWLTEGNNPFMYLAAGAFYTPKPQFYMPLDSDLSTFTYPVEHQ